MGNVSINGPKTPVTEGSSGIASATMPNVCKMPGPPAPFVPTPLPNIGKSGKSPKGYSKKVTIEGKAVAIAGASFGSMGDVASKGLGGGMVSMNCEGPTKFVGPGSFDVQIEGKNVQLLGDPMLNNCGPSGSPPNSATMSGVVQAPGVTMILYGDDADCPICTKNNNGKPTKHPGVPSTEAIRDHLGRFYRELERTFREQLPAYLELAGMPGGTFAADRARQICIENMKGTALLHYDGGRRTFARGYMIGVVICQCKCDPPTKMLVATSGKTPTRGFRIVVDRANAASGAKFVLVDGSARTPEQLDRFKDDPIAKSWECAARHLFEHLAGHKPGQMVERWYFPSIPRIQNQRTVTRPARTPIITTQLNGVKRKVYRRAKSGQVAVSCAKCQPRLPLISCGDSKCT